MRSLRARNRVGVFERTLGTFATRPRIVLSYRWRFILGTSLIYISKQTRLKISIVQYSKKYHKHCALYDKVTE